LDALTCLETRRTAPAIEGPGPSPAQLDTILRVATRAPDHKLLRPWRFVVVRGAGRERLADALVAAQRALDANSPVEVIDKLKKKPLRSPVLIAIIASPAEGGKAPLWEQHASAAAAAQNMCLAAHALGLASAWKSTHLGDAPQVRALLGMRAQDNCFGWIELGTPAAGIKPKDRPEVDLGKVVSELDGAALHAYAPGSA
jgi:nitroreductase